MSREPIDSDGLLTHLWSTNSAPKGKLNLVRQKVEAGHGRRALLNDRFAQYLELSNRLFYL